MKLLFMTGTAGRDKLMIALAKELKQQGLKFEEHYIAQDKTNVYHLMNQNIPKKRIHQIFFMEEAERYDKKDIIRAEQEHDLELWAAWTTTAYRKEKRQRLPLKKIYKMFAYTINRTEKLLNHLKPDILVCYGTDSYDKIIINKIARSKGTKLLELVQARIRDRFVIVDNLKDDWKLKKPSRESIEKAKTFIEEFKKNPVKAQSEDDYQREYLKPFIEWVMMNIRERRIPHDTERIRAYFKGKVDLKHFDSPMEEKYILLPLHYQPEISTLWYGRYQNDQVGFIRNVAKKLPFGYMLYVKEHTLCFGNRPKDFYDKLKKIPNVRLISPYAHTFDLVKTCSLVVTITSTLGFEALMLGKPVISFGDVYYKACSEVVNASNIYKDEINVSNMKVNPKKVESFVASIFETSYDGLVACPTDCAGICLEKGNIKKLARGVVKHVYEIY